MTVMLSEMASHAKMCGTCITVLVTYVDHKVEY